MLLHEIAASLSTPFRLCALGIGVALDDSSIDHPSVCYLRRFPFSNLKVDRKFVSGMTTDTDTTAISRAVISLGRSLAMRVNAESIETEQQFDMLLAKGCNEGQGYFMGRSIPADAFERLFRLQS